MCASYRTEHGHREAAGRCPCSRGLDHSHATRPPLRWRLPAARRRRMPIWHVRVRTARLAAGEPDGTGQLRRAVGRRGVTRLPPAIARRRAPGHGGCTSSSAKRAMVARTALEPEKETMSGQVRNTRNRAGWAPWRVARRRCGTLPIVQPGQRVRIGGMS